MAVLSTLSATIISPPVLRTRRSGLLLDTAQPISSDRWEGGVTFTPLGCATLNRAESLFCTTDTITPGDVNDDDLEQPTFESFAVLADEHCSALSIDLAWLNGRLDDRFRIGISKSVATELSAGTITGHSFDADATPLGGAAASPAKAIALVEQALADVLNGAEGMIHLSPQTFSVAGSNGMFVADGNQWRTRTGHLVVSDAGYADVAVIYGSGPVLVAVGAPRRLGAEGYGAWDRHNTLQATSIAQAIFAYELCSVVSTAVTYA